MSKKEALALGLFAAPVLCGTIWASQLPVGTHTVHPFVFGLAITWMVSPFFATWLLPSGRAVAAYAIGAFVVFAYLLTTPAWAITSPTWAPTDKDPLGLLATLWFSAVGAIGAVIGRVIGLSVRHKWSPLALYFIQLMGIPISAALVMVLVYAYAASL